MGVLSPSQLLGSRVMSGDSGHTLPIPIHHPAQTEVPQSEVPQSEFAISYVGSLHDRNFG